MLDSNNVPVPGATQTISGIEQYRRTLLKLPGGTPTAFSNVEGSPLVRFTQLQDAVYIQDDLNAGHGLHLQGGLRYALQNNPTTFNAITPRVGLLWSPKKSRFTFHFRAGLFSTVCGVIHYLGIQSTGSLDPKKDKIFLTAKGALYLDE